MNRDDLALARAVGVLNTTDTTEPRRPILTARRTIAAMTIILALWALLLVLATVDANMMAHYGATR